MDEQPVQLIKETRQPIAETKNHPQRIDYEYKRNGTASIFMFCEPLAGWRQATAREQRTKFDWAQEVAALLDGRYADCKQIAKLLGEISFWYDFYCRFPLQERLIVLFKPLVTQ